MNALRTNHSTKRQQRGGVLMVMLVFLILGVATYLVSSLNGRGVQNNRDEITAHALAQAKEALIGYAATADTPGKLPCPENVLAIGFPSEGQEQPSCSNSATVIGRLPWLTLKLGDLRDGNGDRLWYARSPGFYSSPINSDTPAQLTIDGASAVAIVFSAGTPMSGQSRPVPTPSSPPVVTQYLDLSNNLGGNAFVSTGPASTFNDKLLFVSHDELFSIVEKRVAGEVTQCLNEYASNTNNSGRYPWAVPLTDFTYKDSSGQLFGRIPDTFTNTVNNSGSMTSQWGLKCNTHITNTPNSWWLDWREMVFYGLANAYKPVNPPSTPTTCPACLTVSPPSPLANKKFVVIIAGKMLSTQLTRPFNKTDITKYLEAPNDGGASTFAQSGVSATFNDTVVFQ